MPLLQDMLQACFYALGGEKNEPFLFAWPTPGELAEIERRRKNKRAYDAGHVKTRHAPSEDETRRKNARRRFRYAAHEEHRARLLAENKKYATAHRLEISEQKSRRKDKGKADGRRRSLLIAESLAIGSLTEIDQADYLVIGADGSRHRERWPPEDQATAWLSETQELLAEVAWG